MAAPFVKGISTATKRARSSDSLRPSETPLVSKASKTEERPGVFAIPAFLRQSKAEIIAKFNELNWQEKIRIAQGRSDPESKWVQDSSPHILQRNRYLGVQPWEKSRIHLRVAEGLSDYINASPISLRDPKSGIETNYIATQGPKKSGLSHFWQMIWHETGDVAVIVMLTPTEESGREKCFQYFPLNAETSPFKIKVNGLADSASEGEVTFIEQQSQPDANTHVRRLQLTIGSETKTVWHLLFTAFPDFGVPEAEDRAELLDLVKLSAEKNSHPENPRTIHCSAGVGRSGTFIALEFLLSQLDSGAIVKAKVEEDPIFDLVQRLREQRMMMVQSDVQYQFLYDVLAEELQKQQLEGQMPGQPSPKLRKLTGGMKAAMLNEHSSTESFKTANVKVGSPGSLEETETASSVDIGSPARFEEVEEESNVGIGGTCSLKEEKKQGDKGQTHAS
ncbi:MAG: hypothetical protein Q9217_001022 [Psora testacea]